TVVPRRAAADFPSLPGGRFHLEDASRDEVPSVASDTVSPMRPLTLALLAGAAILIPVAGSSATTTLSCGSVNQGFENTIVAINVPCSTGKGAARAWHKKAVPGRPYRKEKIGHFVCHSKKTDPEHVKVTCTNVRRPTHHVIFFAGP
ncbi:MAG: hypothetical protein JWM71_947, partial [Solirubrobacteraceae bacterium]|nr:hypothetical protein [Solirubrobacteraceae bacterium]